MKPDDALVLDNAIPGDGGVFLRDGHSEHATGLGSSCLTLMEYLGAGGTNKLFAATATDIYDVSSAGAVGAASVSTLANGQWSHVMFGTAGGQFLVCVNGADGVRSYNGSTWATQTITGATAANFISVTEHMSRLWFVEKETTKVWYLATSSIAGAATSIDFGSLSRHGGSLWAMGSWTRDSGAGLEDVAVFVMSTGETHVYSGSDPSSSTTWARVGTFKLPEPIGRRCLIKTGGDLGLLTTQGLVPISGVLNRAESAQGRVAITDKIRQAYTDAYEESGSDTGWQVVEYPVGKLLLINIPDTGGNVQFVMNSNTGKWCRFTGMDAECWSLKGVDLYFGTASGTVYKYTGTTDLGSPVNARWVSSFSDMGTHQTKAFRRIKPQFYGTAGYKPAIGLRLDFSEQARMSAASQAEAGGTAWDEGDWDTFEWAGGSAVNVRWLAIQGEATHAALVMEVSHAEQFVYQGAKIEFETGDHL